MKVSKQRFQELVSSYLDGEASQQELKLLSFLVKSDSEFARIFYENCQIHIASCKLFGKKPKFTPLIEEQVAQDVKDTPFVVAIEWFAIAVLMFMSVFFFYASMSYAESQEHIQVIKKQIEYNNNLYDVKVKSNLSGKSNVCGYVEFSTKSKIIKIENEKAKAKEK